MTFGEKVLEPETKSNLIKTAHLSFHATGEGIDQVDFLTFLVELGKEYGFTITSGNFNCYYNGFNKVGDKEKK